MDDDFNGLRMNDLRDNGAVPGGGDGPGDGGSIRLPKASGRLWLSCRWLGRSFGKMFSRGGDPDGSAAVELALSDRCLFGAK